ncbi:MAG TPA: hypothetical protein VIF39_12920 [Hyphomicrobium sp.]
MVRRLSVWRMPPRSWQAGAHVGHDNLFHSALGIMQVVTRAYDPSLDLFAACRKPAS